MTIKRVGCYERVSTEEQAVRGFSISAQIDNLTEYCKNNNLKIVDHYTDEGISGTKPPLKRPALQRLLDDVEAGKIDMILFTKLDRWFRSVKEYFKVQDILDRYNVQWKAIHEDYDTTTPNGQMSITIFMAIAQNERDKTAARVKDVLAHKRKNKEACFGGRAVPFGYKKEPDEDGIMRLVKDPKTKDACQDFWNILVQTNNLNKALKHMYAEHGIYREWKSWKRISQTDFYCGMHRGVEDFCEPYVTVENWLKIQEKKPIKSTASGAVYFFRTLMRCPSCGNKLCGNVDKRNGKQYKSYRCAFKNRGCTGSVNVSEIRLENEMLARLDEFIRNDIMRAEELQAKPRPKPKNNIKSLKERQRRLTVAYMAGNVPDDEYLKEDAEIKALIAKAEAEAPPPPPNLEPLKQLLETDVYALYQKMTQEEKQQFWQTTVKEIILEGRKVVDARFHM
jgi:DNA invertase Pin-like site-specific DNA recombinase